MNSEMAKKVAALVALEMAAIASWFVALPGWDAALTPAGIGSLLGMVASVAGAWLGQSPRKAKQ